MRVHMAHEILLLNYGHLGLGDHIICNGIARTAAELCSSLRMFVWEHNFQNVSRLYRDNPKISFILIPTGSNPAQFVAPWLRHENIINIAIDPRVDTRTTKFDYEFHRTVNLPHDVRWSKFFCERDHQEEENAYKALVNFSEPYIFVHDDPSRGFVLTPHNSRGLRVVKNDLSVGIFNLTKVLENAVEIHCMESCLSALIDHLPSIRDEQLFYYPRVRNYPYWLRATTRRSWKEVP